MIKTSALVVALVLQATFVAPSQAQNDAFTKCLADNTTGKDRKLMARWIFSVLAAHPEIKELSNVTPESFDDTSRAFAAVLMRLITESCREETKAVVAKGNSAEAFRIAFGNLGQLSMMELMNNDSVKSAFSGFERYLDKSKMREAVGTR